MNIKLRDMTPEALRLRHEPMAGARYHALGEFCGDSPAMGELRLYGMKAAFDEIT